MATRRTRLKARNTPKSTDQRPVKTQSANVQTRQKIVSTPKTSAGQARISKRVPGKASPRKSPKGNPKLELNTPARQKTKSVIETNKKTTPKDEYEFDEPDDFPAESSFLSASFSAKRSQRSSGNGISLIAKHSKNGSLANRRKGKQQKAAAPEDAKKKTSTPLSDVEFGEQPKKSQGKRRYLRVSVPKLDMDVSITPILPIFSNQSPATRRSPRQKVHKPPEVKSVGFKENAQATAPSQTPAGKPNHRKTQRQIAVAQNLSNLSVSGSFKEPAPIQPDSAVASKTAVLKKSDRKRKSPEPDCSAQPDSASPTNASAKRKKTELPQRNELFPASKKNTLSLKASSANKGKTMKKQTLTRQTKLQLGNGNSEINRKRNKPITSTPVPQPEEKQKGKQVNESPSMFDSGISMGDDLSTSEEANSAAPSSFPGFMEDEPTQSSNALLDDSPFSVPSSSSKEAPALYKSAMKEYKPAKNKRVKGRYSTSKLDAWASAVNQSLEDVESFELVVE